MLIKSILKFDWRKIALTVLLFIPLSLVHIWQLVWDDIVLGGSFWDLMSEFGTWGFDWSIFLNLLIRTILVLLVVYIVIGYGFYLWEKYSNKS
jgi:hypothetical protein